MSGARERRPRLRDTGERNSRTSPLRAAERIARTVIERLDEFAATRERRAHVTLIGLDVSRPPMRLKTRSWAPLAAAALAGALLLAVLRVDVIRIRFGLAESLAEELRLENLKRQLTVEMRQLRDPAELSRRAQALGFERAKHLIDLPADGAPLPFPLPDATDRVGPLVEFAAVDAAPRRVRP